MNRTRVAFVAATAISMFFGCCASAQTNASSVQTDPATESHIQHIISGILPPVLVKGEPIPKKTLAERMAELHVPGISIAYIHDGRIAWARGFGVTKIGGPPVTTDTLFQAGSISKPVTAMAALHLVQAGKLDLDTDVNQYLKSWKVPDNEYTQQKKVTLRELLTHTAGMTVHGFDGYASGTPVPTLIQVLNGESPANSPPIRVDTAPGTIMRYSGGGYVVIQQMLDDVTGEAFPVFLSSTVLAPIGMTRSTFEQPLPAQQLARTATPYDSKGNEVQGGPHIYPEMAPAGLWTTPTDLALFAIEIQKSLSGKSNRVLSKGMTAEMLTPAKVGGWGLGLGLDDSPEHPRFGHNGADEGFQSDLIAYDDGDGVVVMANSDNGVQLANDIERSIATEYGWPEFQPKEHTVIALDADSARALLGQYEAQANKVVITITLEGDQLYVRYGETPKLAVYPESKSQVFLKDQDVEISFEMGADGHAVEATVHQNGAVGNSFTRINANTP
jgi:CubicO group peptidase (beta-lactamase class C family)